MYGFFLLSKVQCQADQCDVCSGKSSRGSLFCDRNRICIKANNVGELEKRKSTPIIVVDGTGLQAQTPANELVKAGFEKVFVLKDGVSGWVGENLPLVRGK